MKLRALILCLLAAVSASGQTLLKQSSTAQPLVFIMIDSTDHISAKTGLSPTVTLSKNGGSFASPSGAVTEIANGWYKVAGNATDTGTLGPLILHATGTGADPSDVLFSVVAFDPQDSVRAGLTALPNAAAEAAGGLYTRGTGTGQINQANAGSITVNTTRFGGTTVTGRDLGASVLLSPGTGTGQISLSSGAVTIGTNNDKTGYSLSTAPPTAATIASAVWQDTTAGDFTTASSIGKSVLNGVSLGTGLTINNLANLPSIPSNWITAAGITSGALNGKGDWNTTPPPTTAAIATGVWQDLTTGSDFTTANSVGKLLKDNVDAAISSRSTYSGADTSGTTTLLSRLTSTRAGLLDNLDATVSSRSSHSAGDIWDVTLSGHLTGGTTGAALNAAGSAGDPWSTTLPGAYSAGTAGYIVGTNLDALVSSRSTYAGGDTSGTTTLLSRLTSTRATNLDNLDATVSSRSTYAGADTSGTTTLLSRLTSTRATNLDNLDAAVSSRSTYAGGDTSGTTTLLSRLTATRAGLLDNLDAAVSSRSSHSAADVWAVGARALTDKDGFTLTSAYDPATIDVWSVALPGSYAAGAAGYLLANGASPGAIASAVWEEAISGHLTAGTTGAKLNAAGSVGDPWASLLPASYGAGTAGAIIGKLDAIDVGHVTISSPVSELGNAITVRAGDTWVIQISDLGNLNDVDKLWFSVNKLGDPDSSSQFFVEKTAGLTTVKGSPYGIPGDGSIVITDASAGNVTVSAEEGVTVELSGNYRWTVKTRTTGGVTVTLATGIFNIIKPGIEAIQ